MPFLRQFVFYVVATLCVAFFFDAVPAVANTTVSLGSVTQITGPQDFDLTGEFIYAINFSANDPARTVSGVTFLPDTQSIPGAVLYGPNNVTPWGTRPEFGSSTDANELEEILQDIRWASSPDTLSAQLAVTAGERYKLQVLISANRFEDRKWDIRVNGQNAVDEITSLGVSPGQTYSQNRATLFSYEFIAPTSTVTVQMGSLFGANEAGDRNPIWQALTLERIFIPPTPDDVVLSPSQFFPAQTAAIGTLQVIDRKSAPVSHTLSFVTGDGSTDNAKFTIAGGQLLPQPFNFSAVAPGTTYWIRVRAVDTADANRFIEKALTVSIAAPLAPTAVTLDATTVSSLSQPGALAGNLQATDPNSFDKHTFALVSGTGSTNNALFTVSGGELRIAQTIPVGMGSVSLRLRATDLAGLTVETVIVLPVIDPQLRINELLSGNTTGLKDESLQPQDWLEIYNALSQPVDLAGWYLTDDAGNLTKWQFPSRVIAANGYLTVFCDGRETPPSGSSLLHTNFSLSSGERVMLVKPDGVTIASELNPTASLPNVTYGWNAAGTQTGYLVSPTPGAVNSALATIGGNAVTFSQPHGFYTSSFSLTLTAAPGSTIRYTLDGSKPTATTGTVYSGPITISPDTNGPTRGTRIVRAIAVNSQAAYAPVVTQTYLFINGTGTPSSNGVVGQSNLVASITGNATYGPLLDDALLALPSVSVILPSGLSTSEAEASVELFNPTGVEAGFQINCGVNATGTTSLGSPKLSMAAKFRTQYGPSKLEYPVYDVGSLAPGAAVQFKELRLRSHSHDTFYWLGTAENPPVPYGSPSITRSGDAQIGRNLWIEEMQILMGQPGKHGRQVHLYLNGSYHGIYHIEEHADDDYMASYFPGSSDDFHYTGGATTGSDHGNGDTWSATWASVKNSLGNYNEAKRWVDVTNLADYMVLSFYAGNDWDWDTNHNWGAAGPKLPDKGGWKFFEQDSDIALQALNADCTDHNVPDGIFYTLMNYEDFRVLFRDRAYKHLYNDGVLTPVKAGALYDARMTEIYTAVIAETARWQPGSSVSPLPWDRDQEWVNEWNYLKNTYFPGRTAVLLNQLRAHPNWWPVEPVVMNQHGGSVATGFVVTLTAPAGSIYYTTDGSDPRSYNTTTGVDTVSPTALLYSGPISILNSRTIRTRVRNSGTWSAINEATFYTPQDFTKLVVTEINYNPPASGAISGDEFEFLELKNIGTGALDLSGCTFTDGIVYTFPIGTILAPGGFFVLARDATAGQTNFHARYSGVTVNGIYTGKLDNNGETITLAAPTGGNIFSITYDDSLPWPVTADGNGFTAVPKVSVYNSDNGLNWRGSTNIFGSPGANDPAASTSVVINEVLTNSTLPLRDTIELFNPTNASVNVGYWWLTDDPSIPKKFQIPANTIIPAGGYAVFNETNFNPTPGDGNSFALNSAGDDVYLFSGDAAGNLTGYSHGFAFSGAEQNVSFGRIVNSAGDEYFPRQFNNTFGAQNSAPKVGPLVINEIMYHPYTGYDEFVEIRNISSNAVPLYDPSNPTNTWKIGGLGYNFAIGQSIPASGYALVVGIDPATFRTKYSVPVGVQIFGPFTGTMQDNGERISLEMPDTPVLNNLGQTVIPYDIIDTVRYNNLAPWPLIADGAGPSLQRAVATAYGDEPTNWFADGLTAGFPNGINQLPTVSITAPATNSPYTVPATVTFTSTASDPDGSILKVEYFSGSTKIGESSTAPNFSFAWTSTPGAHTITAKATDNSLGTTVSAAITVYATNSITQGLKGDYYPNKTLTAPIVGTRTDAFSSTNTINFSVSSSPAWPTNYSFPNLTGTTNFSVRWSGQVRATVSGNYTFSTVANDGVRLFVNGTQIISNWNDVADTITTTTTSSAIALTSGQLYDIVLEYYQNTGTGSINLKWVVPGSFQNNVPQTVLYPDSVPIMVNHPAAVSKDQGQSATFTALASGHGLTYQWRKNGAFISGATSQTYTIPYCMPGDAAQYSVFISNSYGFAISNNAQLTVTFTDTDSDGIQDWWESLYFGTNTAAVASQDSDGDGMTNLQEYLAGTDPNDPNSKFSVSIATSISGPGYTLTFTAMPYKSYTIQYKDTLTATSWTTLQSYSATPVQQTISYTDPAGTSMRFYRIATP